MHRAKATPKVCIKIYKIIRELRVLICQPIVYCAGKLCHIAQFSNDCQEYYVVSFPNYFTSPMSLEDFTLANARHVLVEEESRE